MASQSITEHENNTRSLIDATYPTVETLTNDDDIDKIFETYEKEFTKNEKWLDADSHYTTGVEIDPITKSNVNDIEPVPIENLPEIAPESTTDGIISAVHNIVDTITTNEDEDNKKNDNDRDDRTIVVVVSANVFNTPVPIEGSADKQKEQHMELSYGQAVLDLNHTTTGHPLTDFHNKIASAFFNDNIEAPHQSGGMVDSDENNNIIERRSVDLDNHIVPSAQALSTEAESYQETNSPKPFAEILETELREELIKDIPITKPQPLDIVLDTVPAVQDEQQFKTILETKDYTIEQVRLVASSEQYDNNNDAVLLPVNNETVDVHFEELASEAIDNNVSEENHVVNKSTVSQVSADLSKSLVSDNVSIEVKPAGEEVVEKRASDLSTSTVSDNIEIVSAAISENAEETHSNSNFVSALVSDEVNTVLLDNPLVKPITSNSDESAEKRLLDLVEQSRSHIIDTNLDTHNITSAVIVEEKLAFKSLEENIPSAEIVQSTSTILVPVKETNGKLE